MIIEESLCSIVVYFTRPNTRGKAATMESYQVSHILAKHKNSFKDGDIVKEAFIQAADALFRFKNETEGHNH